MIIHQAEIKIIDEEVVVSARVETIAKTPLPKNLWFKFPVEYYDAVSDRAEGFFTSLFLLAMHLKEDVEVRGEISPKLSRNIEQLKYIYYKKEKKELNLIDFNFNTINTPDPNLMRNIHLSSFSAGADSFYTFWSHFHPEISKHPIKITHGLFIHGFDLILQNNENYNYLFSLFKKQFDEWELPLIKASTNIYSFYQFRLRWAYAHLPPLAGTVNILGNQVSKFFQPGNYESDPNDPQDASSYVDRLSTETLKIHSHAIELTRMEKIIKTFDWEPVQKNLRVCANMFNQTALIGCGKCDKCLNTPLILSIHNKLELFPVYGNEYGLSRKIYFFWKFTHIWRLRGRGYLKLFKEKKQYDLILLFWLMLPINYLLYILRKKILPLFPKNFIIAIKKIVYKSNT